MDSRLPYLHKILAIEPFFLLFMLNLAKISVPLHKINTIENEAI